MKAHHTTDGVDSLSTLGTWLYRAMAIVGFIQLVNPVGKGIAKMIFDGWLKFTPKIPEAGVIAVAWFVLLFLGVGGWIVTGVLKKISENDKF